MRWLGFDWQEGLFYSSDYFAQLYDYAVQLINVGKAYVDSLSAGEIRDYRGTLPAADETAHIAIFSFVSFVVALLPLHNILTLSIIYAKVP